MAIDLCPPAFVEGLLIDMLDNMHAVGGATLINFPCFASACFSHLG